VRAGQPQPVLEPLERALRGQLSDVQAAEWRGWMTVEQFRKRNERLDHHQFGRRQAQTYLWRHPEGEVLCSMDTLQVMLGLSDGNGVWTEEPAWLIASVVTLPKFRGHGHASAMLQQFFDNDPAANSVLYSDVGPAFYERFGFRATPRFVAVRPAGGVLSTGVQAIGEMDFCERVAERRRQLVLASKVAGGALLPQPLFLDWELERFRYFAEIAGQRLPTELFFALPDGHCAGFVPHFPQNAVETLWSEPDCGACYAFGAALTAKWGLAHYRYWTARRESPEQKEECPMIRVPRLGDRVAEFLDPQFCDWW
jgi:GNAT superfamily N-acetyltransferase